MCREFAVRDGITVLEGHIYFDEAQSGAIRARPGLEALKKAAEDKQFDVLLVDDSSRLSRDNRHFNTLLCLFQFWGIRRVSVSDELDMREEHAKVAYQFRGSINDALPDRPEEEDAVGDRDDRGEPVKRRARTKQNVTRSPTKSGHTRNSSNRPQEGGWLPEPQAVLRRCCRDILCVGCATVRFHARRGRACVPPRWAESEGSMAICRN